MQPAVHRTHISSSFPWGFFIISILLLGVCKPASTRELPTSTGSINGTVTDTIGQPVANAVVLDVNTGEWDITDPGGAFHLKASQHQADTILVRHIGFGNRLVLVEPGTGFISIRLSHQNLEAPEIHVTGNSVPAQGTLVTVRQSSDQGNAEHRQMLSGVPGLMIRSYGGAAGIATISLDGGPSRHAKVTLDGFDLTSPQNGETDLSQIPIMLVSEARYSAFSPYDGKEGSVDGTLHLSPGQSSHQLQTSLGSYGHRTFGITAVLARSTGSWQFQAGMRDEDGDYPVEWRDRTFPRENNAFAQRYISLKTRHLLGTRMHARSLFLHSSQERGVAGQVWSPDTESNRKDALTLAGLIVGRQDRAGSTEAHLTLRHSNETFNEQVRSRVHVHELLSVQTKWIRRQSFSPRFESTTVIASRYEAARSSALDPSPRNILTISTHTNIHLKSTIELTPGFDTDLTTTHSPLHQLGLGLKFIQPGSLTEKLIIHAGTQARHPSFNDLYWQPGGNPNLKSEHGRVLTVQSWHLLPGHGDLQIQMQWKQLRNLIQWTPQQSYWQPANVDSVTRFSTRVSWHQPLPLNDLVFSMHGTHTHSQYLVAGDHYGKQLRYAPEFSANAVLNYSRGQNQAHANIQFIGQRIAMYSYPDDTTLPSTTLLSAGFSRAIDIQPATLTLALHIDNITNRHYATILGYPEAGRSWRLTLTLTPLEDPGS